MEQVAGVNGWARKVFTNRGELCFIPPPGDRLLGSSGIIDETQDEYSA